jgi:HlyD family secretion protein
MNEALAKDKLVSDLVLKQSQTDADSLAGEHADRERAAREQGRIDTRPARRQQSLVDQARAVLQLTRQQRDELKVRAGLEGHAAGSCRLKSAAGRAGHQPRPRRQPEPAQGGDQDRGNAGEGHSDRPEGVGRHAQRHRRRTRRPHRSVSPERHAHRGRDAHRRLAEGRGAPISSVDGTIELERMMDVIYMGRPAFGQEQSVVGLFKIGADGVNAERTQVKLGRSSVNTVEILSGLKVGDQVILSDMSAYDAYDRIRLK